MQDRKKDTDVYNGLLDSEGEGEGGMIWENGIETSILSCKSRSPVHVRRRIQHAWGWCTVMTQRDVMGREVGGGVHVWEGMYTRGRFMSMYGKTNTVL